MRMNKKVFVVNFICIHLQSVYPALIMYAWFIMNWGVKMKFYFVAVVMFFFVVNSAYAEKIKLIQMTLAMFIFVWQVWFMVINLNVNQL